MVMLIENYFIVFFLLLSLQWNVWRKWKTSIFWCDHDGFCYCFEVTVLLLFFLYLYFWPFIHLKSSLSLDQGKTENNTLNTVARLRIIVVNNVGECTHLSLFHAMSTFLHGIISIKHLRQINKTWPFSFSCVFASLPTKWAYMFYIFAVLNRERRV